MYVSCCDDFLLGYVDFLPIAGLGLCLGSVLEQCGSLGMCQSLLSSTCTVPGAALLLTRPTARELGAHSWAAAPDCSKGCPSPQDIVLSTCRWGRGVGECLG